MVLELQSLYKNDLMITPQIDSDYEKSNTNNAIDLSSIAFNTVSALSIIIPLTNKSFFNQTRSLKFSFIA